VLILLVSRREGVPLQLPISKSDFIVRVVAGAESFETSSPSQSGIRDDPLGNVAS